MCYLLSEVALQIQCRFPVEYKKFAETEERLKPLPGRSSRKTLSIFEWLMFTTGITTDDWSMDDLLRLCLKGHNCNIFYVYFMFIR